MSAISFGKCWQCDKQKRAGTDASLQSVGRYPLPGGAPASCASTAATRGLRTGCKGSPTSTPATA